MLASLLRGTDWSKVADYLSPVLFQIVPPLALAKQVQILVKSYRDKKQFENLKNTIGRDLTPTPWGITLDGASSGEVDPGNSSLSSGDRLLRLYFWQILSQPAAILDMRNHGWQTASNGSYVWNPSPLFLAWDPEFVAAVRNMYTGFYQANGELLDQGLEAIGLKPGKAVLLNHFGENQDRIAFDLSHFRSSFHDIFLACKEAKARLHPNVIGLGAVLACLYENLQHLGGTYDVRAAFHDAEAYASRLAAKSQENRYAT